MTNPPEWYDKHISKGTIISAAVQMVFVAFLAGGMYVGVQNKLEVHDGRFDRHNERFERNEERINRIEELNITMAEVVLQQRHLLDSISQVEQRAETRYRELLRRVERLERESGRSN